MRFLTTILYLSLLAPVLVRAQLPVTLPPGAAAQFMVPQPAVDLARLGRISATAMFDPPAVRVGDTTFYRVTVGATENSTVWPEVISVPTELKLGTAIRGQVGLEDGTAFNPVTGFVYEVTPTAAGRFVISNFVISAGGQSVEIPATTLVVVESNSIAPAAVARRLWLDVSSTNLFVGQPVRVHVMLPAGPGNQIDFLSDIQFNGSGFMTDKIATRQTVEVVNHDGQQKPAYIFETVATPLTAGSLALSAQGFTAGRNFGGQITISGQGQPVVIPGGVPKSVLLSSEVVHLNVRSLPVEGELPGFTGALGMFRPDQPQLSTNRLRVGEPVHLKYGFKPRTNLTRYVPPEAPRSRDWQIIADQPPGGGFTLIPLTDEALETPAIPFSAFDFATESYYDLTIPALPVTVIGDGLPVQLPAWSSDDDNSEPRKLSALAAMPGKTVAGLKPLQLQGWFVFLQILPVPGFLALWRWDARRRFLEAHPEIIRRQKAKRDLRREKTALQQAVAAGDAGEFVRHAAAAMRIAVAPHFPADAQALVGGDVLSQLDDAGRNGTSGETVRKIFAAADAQFAATIPARADLLGLQSDVAVTLQKLEEKL